MPDITMCYGEKEGRACESRKICYRATVKPSDFRQSYFAVLPLREDNTCAYFTPNGSHDHPECPCGHPTGTIGPCGGCNCADQP
jgi:hypothetical protein